MPKKPATEQPEFRGEGGGPCPRCGAATIGKHSRRTGQLYFGCSKGPHACSFKGPESGKPDSSYQER